MSLMIRKLAKALANTAARFGEPDVPVNNAATPGGPQATTLHETPPELIDRVLNVNPRAVIRLSAAVLQPMLERPRCHSQHCIGRRPGFISRPRRLLHQQSRDHPGHA